MTAVTGFFTDSTLCIGCKACEVACKEWNDVPADGYTFSGNSYDNTMGLGHSTWRHVKFVEQFPEPYHGRWLMMSDVCKHCVQAPCLEVCPTGARALGDLKDPNDPIHEFLRTHKVQVLKPQMATHLKTFYNGLDGAVR